MGNPFVACSTGHGIKPTMKRSSSAGLLSDVIVHVMRCRAQGTNLRSIALPAKRSTRIDHIIDLMITLRWLHERHWRYTGWSCAPIDSSRSPSPLGRCHEPGLIQSRWHVTIQAFDYVTRRMFSYGLTVANDEDDDLQPYYEEIAQ